EDHFTPDPLSFALPLECTCESRCLGANLRGGRYKFLDFLLERKTKLGFFIVGLLDFDLELIQLFGKRTKDGGKVFSIFICELLGLLIKNLTGENLKLCGKSLFSFIQDDKFLFGSKALLLEG